MIELLQSQKAWMDYRITASYEWTKKVVCWMKSTLGEAVVNIVKMTKKDLEYYGETSLIKQ